MIVHGEKCWEYWGLVTRFLRVTQYFILVHKTEVKGGVIPEENRDTHVHSLPFKISNVVLFAPFPELK